MRIPWCTAIRRSELWRVSTEHSQRQSGGLVGGFINVEDCNMNGHDSADALGGAFKLKFSQS